MPHRSDGGQSRAGCMFFGLGTHSDARPRVEQIPLAPWRNLLVQYNSRRAIDTPPDHRGIVAWPPTRFVQPQLPGPSLDTHRRGPCGARDSLVPNPGLSETRFLLPASVFAFGKNSPAP